MVTPAVARRPTPKCIYSAKGKRMHFISASLADIEVSPSLAAAGKDTVTGVFV